MLELLVWLVPLVFSGVVLAVGQASKRLARSLTVLVMVFVLFSSFALLGASGEARYPWIPQLQLYFSVLLDWWSTMFTLVISIVATFILLYSLSYIKEGTVRYYSLFLLFIGGMIGFVLSGNFLQTLIFWETIGVCSFMLIGFWYRKKKAADAGLKALLTTRVGDVCLFLAVLLFFFSTGSFDLSAMSHVSAFRDVISVLLVVAILTKSAQFPFQFWLADAMEGPTTVSALLHSATMVKAGVFLLLRVYPLLASESLVLLFVSAGVSLFLAGFLALVRFDIKRILAFSTVSQMSIMLLAIGSASFAAGFVHLINHAFFKSLLFLGAGILIHYAGTRDIRKIRISRKHAPIIFATFAVGALSLAGIPPFSGFWSKEMILGSVASSGNGLLLLVFAAGSAFTVLYAFRLLSKVFGKGKKVHEHLGLMEVSVIALALLALAAGFTELWGMEFHMATLLLSLGTVFVFGALSYLYFFKRAFTLQMPPFLNSLAENEFYLDRMALSITEAATNFSRRSYQAFELGLTNIQDTIFENVFRKISVYVKNLQPGNVNYSLLAVVLGIAILLLLIVII